MYSQVFNGDYICYYALLGGSSGFIIFDNDGERTTFASGIRQVFVRFYTWGFFRQILVRFTSGDDCCATAVLPNSVFAVRYRSLKLRAS